MNTPAKPALPEPVALIDPRALARGDASLHCITRPEYRSIADADAGVEYVPVYTRAAIDAAVAEAWAVPVLTAFDDAVAAEIQRVSHVEYDAHEICKHFAGEVRKRLAATPSPTEQISPPQKTSDCGHGHVYPRPDGVKARCGGPGLCGLCSRDQGLLLASQKSPSPTEPAMPADQSTIPKGWVPLRMEWEPGYPEDVAFGPQRMMDRLKKWLDKYFARVVAERNADAMPAERVALSNEQIQQHVFAVLQRHSSERLWESFTYQRGPYEITELQPAVVEICRAVIAEYERVSGITPAQGEQP